jgi:hypothetical protein
MTVILNTAQAANPQGFSGSHPVGSSIPVRRTSDGKAYVEMSQMPASEVLVLTNHRNKDEGSLLP